MSCPEKRPVRFGLSVLPVPMTKAQAKRYGEAHIPPDRKAAGITVAVYVSNPAIRGERYYRIFCLHSGTPRSTLSKKDKRKRR